MTPSQLDQPAFLMNLPACCSVESPDCKSTEDIPGLEHQGDRAKAMQQFFEVYQYLSTRALVTLLPTPLNWGLQDLLFAANLGFIPEHLARQRVVILSQFSSPQRIGKALIGKRFFEEMGYEVHLCPFPFEGESDLKYLYGNIYVGRYGQRSSRKAYDWMESEFGIRVIKVRERNPYCGDFDCSVFSVTGDRTLVATLLFSRMELRALEAVTEIIPVNKHFAMMGGCNSVMLRDTWLSGTIIDDLPRSHSFYRPEKEKNWALERLAGRMAKNLKLFNLSRFQKKGACLSCLILHLNRAGYHPRAYAPAGPGVLRAQPEATLTARVA